MLLKLIGKGKMKNLNLALKSEEIDMSQAIKLADRDVRLFYAVLEAHDFVWFASYDVSTISSTEMVVHNYALSYALSRFERGIVFEQSPTYVQDLAQMSLYATPADMLLGDNPFAGKIKQTWNAVDVRTQGTEDPEYKKRNTPKMGKRVVIAPLTRFTFYVFTFDGQQPPGAIRLGKKRAPCRVQYEEIPNPMARRESRTFAPSHLVNPLDVRGEVKAFNPLNISPHLLLRNTRLCNDYVVRHKKHRTYHNVHVPGRVLDHLGV
jgi:CRISPR-associated protein Csc1